MNIEIATDPVAAVDQYCDIPISFRVESEYRLEPCADSTLGFTLTEEAVDQPYTKNYDDEEGERARSWLRWDISNWGFLSANEDGLCVGAAAVAFKTEDQVRSGPSLLLLICTARRA